MRYGFVVILLAVVFGALLAMGRYRAATAPASPAAMPDSEEAKSRRIQAVYARAKAKLDLLRRERRLIVERYAKKADEHRIAEAKKRLEGL